MGLAPTVAQLGGKIKNVPVAFALTDHHATCAGHGYRYVKDAIVVKVRHREGWPAGLRSQGASHFPGETPGPIIYKRSNDTGSIHDGEKDQIGFAISGEVAEGQGSRANSGADTITLARLERAIAIPAQNIRMERLPL